MLDGQNEEKYVQNPISNSMLKRASIVIEDGDFAKADELYEQALNADPENAQAYIGKLMVEFKINDESELSKLGFILESNKTFQHALEYADLSYRTQLDTHNKASKERFNLKYDDFIKRREDKIIKEQKEDKFNIRFELVAKIVSAILGFCILALYYLDTYTDLRLLFFYNLGTASLFILPLLLILIIGVSFSSPNHSKKANEYMYKRDKINIAIQARSLTYILGSYTFASLIVYEPSSYSGFYNFDGGRWLFYTTFFYLILVIPLFIPNKKFNSVSTSIWFLLICLLNLSTVIGTITEGSPTIGITIGCLILSIITIVFYSINNNKLI